MRAPVLWPFSSVSVAADATVVVLPDVVTVVVVPAAGTTLIVDGGGIVAGGGAYTAWGSYFGTYTTSGLGGSTLMISLPSCDSVSTLSWGEEARLPTSFACARSRCTASSTAPWSA